MSQHLEIEPQRLHWLEGSTPAEDLCAHGGVVIRRGQAVVLSEPEGDWTLSAAGLYLLRTLTRSHTAESPVGDQLSPCCGFSMFADEREGADVIIVGCPNGIDGEVIHVDGGVDLRIGSTSVLVELDEWTRAVLKFCRAVESFYTQSAAKRPSSSEDEDGFRAFWREWERRIADAHPAA